VLIYAFRPDSRNHVKYRQWLHAQINGGTAFGIAPQVLASLVRLCTHPKIFKEPDPLEDCLRFCHALLEHPNATIVTPAERHWNIYRELCLKSDARGNLSQDAWFAALALEWGCEWITEDQDYARFDGLKWRPVFATQ
jgi:toxin-antitoxin system PIN domain toxin